MCFIQSVKVLHRKKADLLPPTSTNKERERENSASKWPLYLNCSINSFLSLQHESLRCQSSQSGKSIPYYTKSLSPSLSLFLSIYLYIHTHTHTHPTSYGGSVSLENPNTAQNEYQMFSQRNSTKSTMPRYTVNCSEFQNKGNFPNIFFWSKYNIII